MSKILRLLILFSQILLISCSSSDMGGVIPRNAPLARFSLLDGGYIPLEAYRGRVTVLMFWGVFCSASKSKIVDLNELASKVSPQKVVFLSASVDKASEEQNIIGFIEQQSLNNIIHAFSGNEGKDEAFMAFQCEDVPQIFIIDEAGVVVAKGRSVGDVEEYLEQRGLIGPE